MDNEPHLYKLMQLIQKSLNDVIFVHGEINKIYKIGNSVAIFFKDGNVYKQPLVTKERTIVTPDESLQIQYNV